MTILLVDRNEGYQFPDWAKKMPYADLIRSGGPTSYNLDRVRIWPDTDQTYRQRSGRELFQEVENAGLLDQNLTVKDARALIRIERQRTIPFSLRSRHLALWSSLTEGYDGRTSVPVLSLLGTGMIHWWYLDRLFPADCRTPLYPE